MWLNFSDLIHHGVPDRKGNALPADVTSGTYDLEDLKPGLGGNLIEGKVALDKTFGHLTYGCLTCCGYTPYLSPYPVAVFINGLQAISPYGTNNCTGVGGFSLNTYYNQTGRWSSDNSSIATVTAYRAQGVAPGTTMGRATSTIPNGDGGRPRPPCPQLLQEADAPVPVFDFIVKGKNYIFVGNDPNELSGNSYFLTSSSGGNPQPTGGTVSAGSSDSRDTFGGWPILSNFTHEFNPGVAPPLSRFLRQGGHDAADKIPACHGKSHRPPTPSPRNLMLGVAKSRFLTAKAVRNDIEREAVRNDMKKERVPSPGWFVFWQLRAYISELRTVV